MTVRYELRGILGDQLSRAMLYCTEEWNGKQEDTEQITQLPTWSVEA